MLEEQLSKTFTSAAIGMVFTDLNGRFIRVNPAICQMLGYSESELLTKRSQDLTYPEDQVIDAAFVDHLLKQQSTKFHLEKRYIHRQGSIVWVLLSGVLVLDHDGRPVHLIKQIQDISNRVQAEKNLYDREQKLQSILNAALDAIITISPDGVIQSVNPAAERMFGYQTQELIGQNVKILMPPPYRQEHDGYLRNYMSTGNKRIIGTTREAVAMRKDGNEIPIELSITEVPHLKIFTGVIHDISRRKQLEREVLEIAAMEQRRIGQDLHDSVGQELTALNMLAGVLQEACLSDLQGLRDLVDRIGQGLKRCQRELRAIMRGMLPVAVDSEGLMASLSDLADRTTQENQVACAFVCPNPVTVSDNLTATHLYLLALEAVHNAVKHARPNHITISLHKNDRLRLSVTDDGIGLSKGSTGEHSGLGLRIMQNRAAIIGGQLVIQPHFPSGTQVVCTLARHAIPGQVD